VVVGEVAIAPVSDQGMEADPEATMLVDRVALDQVSDLAAVLDLAGVAAVDPAVVLDLVGVAAVDPVVVLDPAGVAAVDPVAVLDPVVVAAVDPVAVLDPVVVANPADRSLLR
jgi:hypothetical protein